MCGSISPVRQESNSEAVGEQWERYFLLTREKEKQWGKALGIGDGIFCLLELELEAKRRIGTERNHTAVALGLSAIEAGYKACFIKVVELVQELLLASM